MYPSSLGVKNLVCLTKSYQDARVCLRLDESTRL